MLTQELVQQIGGAVCGDKGILRQRNAFGDRLRLQLAAAEHAHLVVGLRLGLVHCQQKFRHRAVFCDHDAVAAGEDLEYRFQKRLQLAGACLQNALRRHIGEGELLRDRTAVGQNGGVSEDFFNVHVHSNSFLS